MHPEGEALRRAVRWISGHLEQDAQQPIPPLVDSATMRFDLTPRESEYLYAFYRDVAAETADDQAGGQLKNTTQSGLREHAVKIIPSPRRGEG